MAVLEFQDDWTSRDGGGEYIKFNASDGERSFICKVSREAIEDLHGRTEPGPNWISLFEPVKREVQKAIQSKYDAGCFEPDGSIFLTGKDVS